MSMHVGYAGRTHEHKRFVGDNREVHLEISAECAQKIAEALYALGADRIERPGSELLGILGDMGFPAS
jgi:hypothetical protein